MIALKMSRLQALIVLLFSLIGSATYAQSDPSLFDTVINIPYEGNYPFVEIYSGQSITASTQINLKEGGMIEPQVTIGLSGFLPTEPIEIIELNMSGGTLGYGFRIVQGGVANISGGSIGTSFVAGRGSDVEIFGGEFQLNGVPYSAPRITLNGFNDGAFSGTLSDGSPFILSTSGPGDVLIDVALTQVALPAKNTSPITIDSTSTVSPLGLRPGEVLTLFDGGELGANINRSFQVVEAQINVDGGLLRHAEIVGGTVYAQGGSISNLRAFSGSLIDVAGGDHGIFFIEDGAVLKIKDGTLSKIDARSAGEAVIEVSGGNIGKIDATQNSEIYISGGTIGDGFETNSARLQLSGGSIGNDFDAAGGVISMTGGSIGDGFTTGSVMLDISGGSIGDNSRVQADGDVNFLKITNGTIGNNFYVRSGIANIDGGIFGNNFRAGLYSTIDIQGGLFGQNFEAHEGSHVSIRGGEFLGELILHDGSTTQLVANNFFLNGVPIEGLSSISSTVLSDRDVELSGTWADGSSFSFYLNSIDTSSDQGFYSTGATISLQLIPEPTTAFLALAGLVSLTFNRSRL